MTKWVEIDDMKYTKPVREGRPGLPPIERAVSAYEIPSRIGVMRDPSSPSSLVVVFEYLSPEPEVESRVSETLRVRTGQNSGRLRKAIVDLQPLLNNDAAPSGDTVASFVSSQVTAYLKGIAHVKQRDGAIRFIPSQILNDNRHTVSAFMRPSRLHEGI